MTTVSVIVPTIKGREDHYRRLVESYYETLTADGYVMDLCTAWDKPTCGMGWQDAAEKAKGDYLHFTCDDIEALPGWAPAAIRMLDAGAMPAPRVLNAATGAPEFFPKWGVEHLDGTPAGFSCLPMIKRDMWPRVEPLLTCHYSTDTWISYRAQMLGYPPIVVRGYAFKHHWAEHKRGAGLEYEKRLAFDQMLFQMAAHMAESGQWNRPWPTTEESDDLLARVHWS